MSSHSGRSARALAGAQWSGRTLVIDDPAALKRIRRKEISPSAVSGMTKCPASFAADSVLPRSTDPFQPFLIGTGAHEAMEHLFQRDPEDRTEDFVRAEVQRIEDETWAPRHLALAERRRLLLPDAPEEFVNGEEVTDELVAANATLAARWRGIVLPWTLGIFTMTGQPHPRDVDVFGTELAVGGWNYEERRANEVTLSLQGLRGPFPVQGKIDRTDWVTLPDGRRGLSVRDYKFPAKTPRALRQDSDYAHQQRGYRLYFGALHPDLPVVDAALLYPGYDKVASVDISEGAVMATLRRFENAYLALNRAADTHQFDTRPSNLCGWCPLVNACPVAKVTTENAATSAATKPSGPELGLTVSSRPARVSVWAETSDYSRLPGVAAVPQIAPQPRAGRTALDPVHRYQKTVTNASDQGAPMPSNTLLYPASEHMAINLFSATDAAVEHLVEQGADLTPTSISSMTAIVAGVIEETVRTLFGGSFDWGHGRTGRVLYATRESMRVRPAPVLVPLHDHAGNQVGTRPGTRAEWDDWRARIVGLTAAKARTALSVADGSLASAIPDPISVFASELTTPEFQSVGAVA